jgi:hypothetical protein
MKMFPRKSQFSPIRAPQNGRFTKNYNKYAIPIGITKNNNNTKTTTNNKEKNHEFNFSKQQKQ